LMWSGLPTLWRSYLEFGPSMENPYGHGGFLSPKNGACMTRGPLPDAENESVLSPTSSGSQKRAREKAQTDQVDSRAHEMGKSQLAVTERLMAAMEAAVEISKERMRNTVAQDVALAEERNALFLERSINSQERQINHIKVLLDELGDFMEAQEKNDARKKLYELRKSIASGVDS
jgi:hypothetical protein